MSVLSRRRLGVAGVAAAAALAAVIASPGSPSGLAVNPGYDHGAHPTAGSVGDESHELMDAMAQYHAARTAPTAQILPGAYTAAWNHVLGMPSTGGSYSEVTAKPYNSDDPNYSDRVWSNAKGGSGYVTGRMGAVAVDPNHAGTIFAGGADGGVFKSTNDGATWAPVADHLPALAVGALAVAPDGALWLATGEGTTAFDNYQGTGVYRLAPGATTFTRVGGTELDNLTTRQLRMDPAAGYAYAATLHGVWRHSLADSTSPWTKVLAPCAGVGVSGIPCGASSYYADIANDVAVQPGTGGRSLVANVAWRSGASYNGFYYSNDAGDTWALANPGGAINPHEIGNATFGYAADGSKLYVVMESPTLINKAGANSVLAGVYVSNSGNIAGPYSQIATSSQLANSGSAMKRTVIGPGYQPGVQAWYNQFIGVDPADANHVYLGLEEVYETRNGGSNWNTIGRYWNFGLSCFSYDPAQDTCDGNVVHSDQHAIAFGNGRVYIGNDGGAYSRPTTQTAPGWTNLNRSGTLRTLQYYGVGVGKDASGGVDVWGGLQDNGQSLLRSGAPTQVSPVGGDGGIQLVDRNNGCHSLGEYVYLELLLTVNCGQTNVDGTPQAVYDIAPGDPNPRFIAPFDAADNDPSFWVAGGQFVYENTKTWNSRSGKDWSPVYDLGDVTTGKGASATALTSVKVGSTHVTYAAWCGRSCNPGSAFGRGIATNYGGSWHQLTLPAEFPNRYIQGLRIDPADPTGATVYATISGFSRHWNQGPGAGYGHVWRTTDAGATWTDVSGDTAAADSFPDAPANDLRFMSDHTLVVSTDLGVFEHPNGSRDGHWVRVGPATVDSPSNLPTASAVYLNVGPDGYLYVATHGRGIWKTLAP